MRTPYGTNPRATSITTNCETRQKRQKKPRDCEKPTVVSHSCDLIARLCQMNSCWPYKRRLLGCHRQGGLSQANPADFTPSFIDLRPCARYIYPSANLCLLAERFISFAKATQPLCLAVRLALEGLLGMTGKAVFYWVWLTSRKG